YVVNNPLTKIDADGHTHQECGAQTSSIDPTTGAMTVNANCHDVPDWWNVWTNLKNWRDNVKATMDANAIKHQPVRMGNENGDQALEDLNNLMMGLEPVGTAKSPGNMQRQVEKGQAPKSVDRV